MAERSNLAVNHIKYSHNDVLNCIYSIKNSPGIVDDVNGRIVDDVKTHAVVLSMISAVEHRKSIQEVEINAQGHCIKQMHAPEGRLWLKSCHTLHCKADRAKNGEINMYTGSAKSTTADGVLHNVYAIKSIQEVKYNL